MVSRLHSCNSINYHEMKLGFDLNKKGRQEGKKSVMRKRNRYYHEFEQALKSYLQIGDNFMLLPLPNGYQQISFMQIISIQIHFENLKLGSYMSLK